MERLGVFHVRDMRQPFQHVIDTQQGILDIIRGSGLELVIHPCNRRDKDFLHGVRGFIDHHHIRTVVIDSLNGYQAAMPEENALVLHMHELLLYLNRKGAATFMTVAQHGLVGDMQAPVDITYLADTVILLRYFEALGKVRRAISIIKKRTGSHESTIREYRISTQGMTIGEPLETFQGVLRGVPTYLGASNPLLREETL